MASISTNSPPMTVAPLGVKRKAESAISSSQPRHGSRTTSKQRQSSRRNHPPPTLHPPVNSGCSVCPDGLSNYKCPKCRAPYCSIACCRQHKQVCVVLATALSSEPMEPANGTDTSRTSKYVPLPEPKSVATSTAASSQTHPSRDKDEYDYLPVGWTMTHDMQRAVRESTWLRNELQDAGLQQLIRNIVATPNTVTATHRRGHSMAATETTHREQVLHELQTEYPRLRLFLDKLRVVAGVLTRPNESESLSQWLERDDTDADPLVLLTLPPRRAPRRATTAPPSDVHPVADAPMASNQSSSSEGSDESSETESDSESE